MNSRGLRVAVPVALLLTVGCGDDAAAGQPLEFASGAVPSVSPVAAAQANVPDETAAVLSAYTEYVIESDRFFDESIAQAAAAGAYAGSPELDAILDAVAMGRIREFDMETPQSLWEKGGVITVGTPRIIQASVVRLDGSSTLAEVRSCTDVNEVDYLDDTGRTLKPAGVPGILQESVTLSKATNPRNADVVKWYVVDRTSEQVEACQ